MCLLLALAACPSHASRLEHAWRLLWPSKQQETVHVVFSNHLVRLECPPYPEARSLPTSIALTDAMILLPNMLHVLART